MKRDAFAPHHLATDIRTVHDLFAHFFTTLSSAEWHRPTERNGWTLHETIAHLDAVAWGYQQVIRAILTGQPFDFAHIGIQRREDLPGSNETQIALRRQRPIAELCTSFLTTLEMAAASAAQRQPVELTQTHPFPAYNNEITLAQLYGGQATHPGLVHAAQVARGANVPPLWRHYHPELLKRQLTRFFHLMSLAYWPERGQMQKTINFIVPRQASWHLCLSLEDCKLYEGKGERPSLIIWFRTLDALCRALTLQIGPLQATFTGQAFAWGSVRLLFRLESLFNPTVLW